MAKRTIKIAVINILLAIFFVVALESFCAYKASGTVKPVIKKESFDKKFDIEIKNHVRNFPCPNCEKAPLILSGCSYAYGQYLDKKDSLGAKLAQKTGRAVYNYAFPATGVQHAYYALKNMPAINKEPEYVFYFFISDHIRRMYVNCIKNDIYENLEYEIKDGKLIKKDNRFNIFDNFYLPAAIKNAFVYPYKSTKKSRELFKNHIFAIQNEVKGKYPNAKFIAILFDEGKKWRLPYELIDELKAEGVSAYYFSEFGSIDFNDEKYRLDPETDSARHPNALLWDEASDILIEKFGLNN